MLKTLFINSVKDFIIFGFSKLVEMLLIPILFLDGRLSIIVFCTINSSTLLSVNLQFKFSLR